MRGVLYFSYTEQRQVKSVIPNLKQAAKTLNFLTEHGIDTYPDLKSRVAEITAASDEAAAALYAEIIKDRDEVKRCCECGATFQPKSNRAKYCAACAKRMRRRKEAERQRKRYWQHEA